MQNDVSKLKEKILERFKSVHAFCKANPEITRSTVYLILSGKYSGQYRVQADKILNILENARHETQNIAIVTQEKLHTKLQEYKCSQCRRLDSQACHGCRAQTIKEAFAMYEYIYKGVQNE